MSLIDEQIGQFYDHIASQSWNIDAYEKWMKDYESKRMNYPAWETKDGRHIWVYEIEDSHLDNLIPYIQRQDPENKTHWIDVFSAERKYRELSKKIEKMKSELAYMRKVGEICL